ncbi:MAG: Fic family protein [Rhodothermaceae bacterium]|nr:Fic family protein [Bacteroidota bacterium]MXX96183.1 Fic family protein [Rhodothermaceae bacterium]MXZ17213.1 Fic family protein [Rhodothermaceae bacterium]MXZ57778.1 Fic family protein [Rhodothermaceae bacterium]MYB91710.1 Fic family protein [Rhodothermaceae bacterium]
MQVKKSPHHIGKMVEVSTVGKKVKAYLPPLLPLKPPIDLGEMASKLERATHAVGQLDGMTRILPSTQMFLHTYIRQESVLSSQIEGTESSLSDLLLFEAESTPKVALDDVQEVSNYVNALTYGLLRLKSGFPLSQRLMREMHGILLSTGHGRRKDPGEYRRSQNWIGGLDPENAKYVPPPATYILDLMSNLERFIHDDHSDIPVLIQAGILHVQFEIIHPFLDGNGRLGRLLITLLLCERRLLKEPLLYLSFFFNAHRAKYYALLQRVHTHGDWQSWLEFFLDGVFKTAERATRTAEKLLALFDKDQNQIKTVGKSPPSMPRVHRAFQERPFLTVPFTAKSVGISPPTARKSIRRLEDIGIVREVTGKSRNQVFVYEEYMKILTEGTATDV